MLLNLSIVRDRLSDEMLLQEKLDAMAPRTLHYARQYHKGEVMDPKVLYIASSEDLPVDIELPEHLSVICFGFPPPVYNSGSCELLCFSASKNKTALFQEVLDAFYFYADYDELIKDMIIAEHPIRDFGEIALDVFGTPASAFGVFEKILFIAYDPERPEGQEMYGSANDEYFPEDEKSILYKNEEFLKTFEAVGPTYSGMSTYKTSIIFYNLFDRGNYIGRFMIENTYRPFRGGDYRLVEWFGEYVKLIIGRSREYHFKASREFDQMVQSLTVSNARYREEYDLVIKSFGWDRNDRFLCQALIEDSTLSSEKALNEAAFYLEELFDGQYIFIQNNALLQVIDLNRTSLPMPEIERRMNLYLSNNALWAGSSTIYEDFADTPASLRQARLMARYALKDRQKKLYHFDKEILNAMMSVLDAEASSEVFCTSGLKTLIEYDKENRSELIPTLKCYLENNCNISQTYEKLFIARTTCLYRIRRIEEVSGFDLDDPDTALYLRMVLRLLR